MKSDVGVEWENVVVPKDQINKEWGIFFFPVGPKWPKLSDVAIHPKDEMGYRND